MKNLPNKLTMDITKHIGICYKYWPPDCTKKKLQGGAERPVDPPSIFGTTNPLCFAQTLVSPCRNVNRRSVTAGSRAAREDLRNTILSWEDLMKYGGKFAPDLMVNCDDTSIKILKIDYLRVFW